MVAPFSYRRLFSRAPRAIETDRYVESVRAHFLLLFPALAR